MAKGFNLQTKKIEELKNYKVLSFDFDIENDFLVLSPIKGLEKLESFFAAIVKELTAEDFLIEIALGETSEEVAYEELVAFFNVFTYILAQHGRPNGKGFLRTPQEALEGVVATNFSLLEIFNNDFIFGTIQMTLIDKEGYHYEWVK